MLHDFVVVQPAECAWRSNEQNARSVFVKERTRAKAYWKALEFVSAHKQHLPFDRMISTHYSLDEVNVALQRMKTTKKSSQ